MADLVQQVKTFLEAEGFSVGPRRDFLTGSRRIVGEETEYVYVWVIDSYDPSKFSTQEPSFLARFKDASENNPSAMKFLVVPTREGMSRAFTDGARQWYRVNILAPILFFDTNLNWEASRESASAVRDLRDKGERLRLKRVSQPFLREDNSEIGAELLDPLYSVLVDTAQKEKSIHVVVGPAGIGKSCLFEVLFAQLHEAFMAFKTRGAHQSPRPLPLIPEYQPLADGKTVRSLLDAYLRTDFARPLRRSVFEWMLTNGFAIWMVDGLDEIIAQDPGFFDYILDLITKPEAPVKPKILICVRDSLMATNAVFREFCEEYHDEVTIWQLTKWGASSKRLFAELVMPNDATRFIRTLQSHPSLDELASVPYYCDLLCQQFQAGNIRDDYSETSLLQEALSSIVERDYKKGFLNREVIKVPDVHFFLEAIASEDYATGFRGIPIRMVTDWARTITPTNLQEEEIERVTSGILNLAAFAHASPGYIRFSQEILEQYLIGKYFTGLLETAPDTLVTELARRDFPNDSLALRIVAEKVKSFANTTKLKEIILRGLPYKAAFKNAIRVAALCVESPNFWRDIPYARQDLTGILFKNLDLSGVSFRGTNLSDVYFDNCILKRTDFGEAIIKNTAFLSIPKDGLREAKVGDLTRFFSMRIGANRVISDQEEAHKWFVEVTGERSSVIKPCKTALQLRFFCNKFIYPEGTPRRSVINRKGILAGKRVHPDPEKILEGMVSHGFLHEEERFRDRLHRPEGDLYAEMVTYATELRMGPRIKVLLDDICEETRCLHVPQPTT